MSYIRSTSNPERLYIWSDGNHVYIAEGCKKIWTIPPPIFHGLIKKSYANGCDECEYKEAKIKEVYVNKNFLNGNLGIKVGEFKMRFSYKKYKVDMWLVTWHYIVNSNYERRFK